jgi:hypothetical protein
VYVWQSFSSAWLACGVSICPADSTTLQRVVVNSPEPFAEGSTLSLGLSMTAS